MKKRKRPQIKKIINKQQQVKMEKNKGIAYIDFLGVLKKV